MGSIDINLIANEMQRYVVQNKKVVKADFARALNVGIDKYCTKRTKIKGVYQTLHSLMTHVVQGFKPEWKELGKLVVKDKELKNYHQKINFGFVPADVLGTFLADWYEEGKEPPNKEVAKRIVDWILTQITSDVALLSMTGEYDPAQAFGKFGFSLKGWNRIISDMLINTVNPCYKIPLDALTSTNIVSQVERFELNIPDFLDDKIKEIHMSKKNAQLYKIDYRNTFGELNTNFGKDGNTLKSPLAERNIVAHSNLDNDKIWATIDGNMVNLIDVIDNPATIDRIEVDKYEVLVFGEFWKGWDCLINQAVCVADFSGTTLGLGDEDQMKLYYPHSAA